MADNDTTVLIGITGSIGAGKSVVSDLFEAAGIPVLRADDVARELMNSDEQLVAELVERFGDEVFRDGELNRPYLAEKVFADRELLEELNLMVHPRTIARQGVLAAELFAAGNRIVACEAALIYETDGENRFDYIVVVDAREELRLERAARRDNSDLERVRQRDAMQMPAEQKVERADFVIHNNGSLEDLHANAAFVIEMLKCLPPRHRLEEATDEGVDEQTAD